MFTKNKKELLIHIGAGKTGTTSLQYFFWANRRALKTHGILYPELGAVAGAHHLLSPHLPPFLNWTFIPAAEWAPQLHAKMDKRALISSEIISSATPDVVRAFAPQVNRYFKPKIILYVRRQDRWMVAAYSQQVKAGTQRLDFTSSPDFWFRGANFAERLKAWTEAFGAENIIVRPYERGQLSGGDIRRDFLNGILGIDDDEAFNWTDVNENPRLTFSALEYKRLINNVVPVVADSRVFVEPLLAYSAEKDQNSTAIYNESSLLSAIERRMILNRVAEANSGIARDLMGRADGVLFAEETPKEDKDWVPPVATPEDFAEISDYLNATGHGQKLLQCIDEAVENNRFEGYRHAQTLAASFGRKL